MKPTNQTEIKLRDVYKRLMTVAELLNKTQSARSVETGCSEKTQKQQAVVS